MGFYIIIITAMEMDKDVFYMYDPWNVWWIEKVLKYDNGDIEIFGDYIWEYKVSKWVKLEMLENMKDNGRYVDGKEYKEKLEWIKKKLEWDLRFDLIDPWVYGWKKRLKYIRKDWKVNIKGNKIKEFEEMMFSSWMWDWWDCYMVEKDN